MKNLSWILALLFAISTVYLWITKTPPYPEPVSIETLLKKIPPTISIITPDEASVMIARLDSSAAHTFIPSLNKDTLAKILKRSVFISKELAASIGVKHDGVYIKRGIDASGNIVDLAFGQSKTDSVYKVMSKPCVCKPCCTIAE